MKTFTPAERAVLKVLAYAAVFSGSVKRQDLSRYQLSSDHFSARDLQRASTSLWESGLIRALDTSSQRPVARGKWQQVGEAVQFLRRFPEIESIWVTGSLAVGNIQASDDIDLMIVTTQNSLWWTRTLVAVRDVFSRRVRRRHDENGKLENKWCCNLWLETETLQLSSSQRSLYTAREVVQAVPVFQRRPGAAAEFLVANSWVSQHLPVGYAFASVRAKNLPVWYESRFLFWPPLIRSFLNTVLFTVQKQRMQRYRRHEIVEVQRAFFHPGERAKEVQREYERILRLVLEYSL